MFSKLRRLKDRWISGKPASSTFNLAGGNARQGLTGHEELERQVRWRPASDNEFGVEVLDCSAFARSMVSCTSDAGVAARFTQLRGSQGEHCRGRNPENAMSTECRLEYPQLALNRDGPLFQSGEMEEKWDIFCFEGTLYFTRSWSGNLVYRASVVLEPSQAVITQVTVRGSIEDRCPDDTIAAVDYLIKSHVYGLVAPHPLLPARQTSPEELAYWSFGRYGCRGLFGTREDVTRLRIRLNDKGEYILVWVR